MNFQPDEQFGAILEINELRRDLARYDRAYKKLANDRKKLESSLQNDRKKLESSLQSSMINSRHENNKLTAANTTRKEDSISLKHMQI